MVLPLLVLFLLGTIDVGRLMWTWNQAEKATQMGVRFAVATDPIPTGLATYSYAIDGNIPQGDIVPKTAFPQIHCTNAAACTCVPKTGETCPASMDLTRNAAVFTNLVDRMASLNPDIAADKVSVDYDYSGLGFSGDPNGPDVSPLITITLRNLTFRPLFLLNAVAIPLPSFAATLTMEDGAGTNLN